MLSILLINDNKIVSRLLKLSSQKHNYDLEEIVDYNPKNESYNILFVDSGIYNNANLISLLSRVTFDKVAYIGDKADKKPEEFDLMLEKPFLPTDFVNIMNENFKVMDIDEIEKEPVLDDIHELEELDLDALDDIDEEPSLEVVSNDQDLEVKDEIADVLSDIDELDSKVEEGKDISDEVQESLSDISDIDENQENDSSLVEDSLKAVATAGAGVAAASVMANSSNDSKDEIEKVVESIDKDDIKDALGLKSDVENEEEKEQGDYSELIESSEVVESSNRSNISLEDSNLEEIVSKAVSKAITKEFLTDVLKDMDIVISFKPKGEG